MRRVSSTTEEALAFGLGFLLVCIISGFLLTGSFEAGKTQGREELHKGEYQCLTLPDERVECYKVKKDQE